MAPPLTDRTTLPSVQDALLYVAGTALSNMGKVLKAADVEKLLEKLI